MAQIPAWFVVVMGIGTVFVGLICIVLICSLLGAILKKSQKTFSATNNATDPKQMEEILAVIAASVATAAKTTPKSVKILSVKKVK